jgi:hypothetical protein
MNLADETAIGLAPLVQREFGHRLERRLERSEAFHGRLRTRELLAVERERSVRLVDGHQALVEMAVADGVVGALLALEASASRASRGMFSSVAMASAQTP